MLSDALILLKQYIIPNGYFICRASVCLMVELVLTITPKCTYGSALVININAILTHYLNSPYLLP